MKFKRVLLISALLIMTALPAKAEKRIAVLPFDVPESKPEMKQFGIGITDTITIALSGIKEFIMIDRSQFQNILKEQSIQQTGLIEADKAVKLGKLMGAEMLVVGSIQTDGGNYRITARITEVETGKIIKAVQVTGSSIFDLQDKLAGEIISQQKVNTNQGMMAKIKKILYATNNVNAYDFYIKGRNQFLQYSLKGFQEAIKNYDKALEQDKAYTLALASKAEAQALLSSELEVNGKPFRDIMEKAEYNALEALKQQAELGDVHRALSTVYKIQGKFPEGKKEAEKALELNPNDADAYYLLWANSNGKPDDPMIEKAVKLNPSIVKKHLAIGYAYYKQSKYNEAIAIYKEALKLIPEFASAHIALGYAYERMGELDNAISEFKEAVEINNYMPDSHSGLGLVYFKTGKLKESLAEFNKAKQINANYSFAYSGLGYVYFEQGKHEEAFKEYKLAIDLNPDDFYARNGLGYYYLKKGNIQEATDQFRTAMGINYSDVESHYNISLVYKEQNNIYDAERELKEAIKINPYYLRAYKRLAEIYSEQKKFSEAKKTYQEAMKLRPEDSSLLNGLGIIFYLEGKYEEATENYLKALKFRPDDVNTHNNLGAVYFAQNKMNESVSEYLEALKLNPSDINANENLALAYDILGKKEMAKEINTKLCELGKQNYCH